MQVNAEELLVYFQLFKTKIISIGQRGYKKTLKIGM